MNKYEVIIYWSEDNNAFIAEVPELAGCMAMATPIRKHWLMSK
jgi:predicted RNase H-like HicB family nuclease